MVKGVPLVSSADIFMGPGINVGTVSQPCLKIFSEKDRSEHFLKREAKHP